ncbi:lipopolysaccharide biosynthesis protein [Hafnia alvei FB1]|uniref:Lipopolysaccharide biosynthesis protein n=2 Tax=Hafnia alvei TaxID=569 RepID=A0A097R3S2_HAFAL|nr:lipopolysaccharide biosynthesis protein [Hafnia alvei]AIU73382.1 lipopolysaccharide biosynthesis protein [Hafnia alvei FB1]TBL63609.1 lipopolysaccharide biosynthesis protein [Hafnia alvei]
MSELKNKTVNGLKWSALERILSQGAQLVLMLILARMLGPKAFGLIGMLAIFIAIGQVFIDSGFSSALIRKNDRSNIDYSTAFYFNIFVAVIFYIVLFITSPFISDFYQQPELTSLTKVIGLSLIINSFTLVPRTILTVSMNFKAQAKASICSVIIGGVIALTLAKCGYGVWALVAQTLSMALCNAVFLNVVAKWIPSLNFSKESFSYLFGFGGKLLASGLLDTAYNNLYQIVIGKKFDVVNVGQYTQANQISSIPAMTMTNVIQRVTYPMFSHMQDNHKKMQEYYLLTIKVAALFIFPLMAGIAIISKPLIHMFLGSQWGEASNLIMVLAFAYMLYPIHAINLNILQVKGRSDLFLKLEVIKKILGLAIIAITMQVGILYMCIGLLFHSYISLILNTYYTEKLTGLKIKNQVKEIFPIWIITLISSFIAWTSANYLSEADTIQVISMICIAVVIYLTLICLTQKKVVKIILSIKNQG